MKQSPFLTHKEILLSGYGAARWLRRLTLSLWNGYAWPADLSGLAGLDERHFQIALEFLTWYRQYGEDDRYFIAAAEAARKMELEAKKQAEEQAAYGEWVRLVDQELRRNGKSEDLTWDNYDWFFSRFEKGLTPAQVTQEAIAGGLQ